MSGVLLERMSGGGSGAREADVVERRGDGRLVWGRDGAESGAVWEGVRAGEDGEFGKINSKGMN